jgi:hypothetical protein
MKHACLVPATHEEDLTNAMATQVRTAGVDLSGDVDAVETRVIEFLVTRRQGRVLTNYRWADIKVRLTDVIRISRELGPIDLHQPEVAGA